MGEVPSIYTCLGATRATRATVDSIRLIFSGIAVALSGGMMLLKVLLASLA